VGLRPRRQVPFAAPLVVALPLALGFLLASARPVQASVETGGDSGGSWIDRLNPAEWFDRTRDAFFEALLLVFTDPERGLPALLGRAVQGWLRSTWNDLAALFAPFNVFTQIPTWIVGVPFVDAAWNILFPIAAVALGLAAVLTLALSMLSIMGGRPPAVLFAGLRHFMRGTVGLILGTRLYFTLIEVSNSLAGRVLDPTGGLPGLDRLTAFGQAVTFPVLALVYMLFACLFFFVRLKVVFTCIVCLILCPLM
jgi:hypothetical protein